MMHESIACCFKLMYNFLRTIFLPNEAENDGELASDPCIQEILLKFLLSGRYNDSFTTEEVNSVMHIIFWILLLAQCYW
jgi:hypothetical protein